MPNPTAVGVYLVVTPEFGATGMSIGWRIHFLNRRLMWSGATGVIETKKEAFKQVRRYRRLHKRLEAQRAKRRSAGK